MAVRLDVKQWQSTLSEASPGQKMPSAFTSQTLFAPPYHHLLIKHGRMKLSLDPKENRSRSTHPHRQTTPQIAVTTRSSQVTGSIVRGDCELMQRTLFMGALDFIVKPLACALFLLASAGISPKI